MSKEKMSKKLQQAVEYANETNPSSRKGGHLPNSNQKNKQES
ncbi:hypothetical protein [Litchfieldia salsa]|uniref:Uncharacterized protein n=1 Tax=Litchfieldia salsa TaxID=930152 RepID=A0A1H0TDZ2_9BACI|nr:hypothetical protein [Litchfieldia salsa]SDP52247.1 hypothetical protein SAMN05216565_103458 [Litchfieldia salsa]